MGNFIQIYQKEGTKGLWKVSFFELYPTLQVRFLAQLNFAYFYSILSQNKEKSVANMCVIFHDYFTAGVSVHFDKELLPLLCSRISHFLKKGETNGGLNYGDWL